MIVIVKSQDILVMSLKFHILKFWTLKLNRMELVGQNAQKIEKKNFQASRHTKQKKNSPDISPILYISL